MADVEEPESCLSDSGQAGGPTVTTSVFLASSVSDPSSPSLCPDPLSHPRLGVFRRRPYMLGDPCPLEVVGPHSSRPSPGFLVSDGPQLCPQRTGLCRRHSDLEQDQLNAS